MEEFVLIEEEDPEEEDPEEEDQKEDLKEGSEEEVSEETSEETTINYEIDLSSFEESFEFYSSEMLEKIEYIGVTSSIGIGFACGILLLSILARFFKW